MDTKTGLMDWSRQQGMGSRYSYVRAASEQLYSIASPLCLKAADVTMVIKEHRSLKVGAVVNGALGCAVLDR